MSDTEAEIHTKTWRRKDVWFDIFGTESLTLPGQAAWRLLLHGNRVCLFSEPLSRMIVFRVRLARPQHVITALAGVHTQRPALTPVKTKTPSLLITASVQIPANTIVTTASR